MSIFSVSASLLMLDDGLDIRANPEMRVLLTPGTARCRMVPRQGSLDWAVFSPW